MTELDKIVSCDLARTRFLSRSDQELKNALRQYQAGECLEPNNWSFFDDVTVEDAAEMTKRHQEILLELLESRGVKA